MYAVFSNIKFFLFEGGQEGKSEKTIKITKEKLESTTGASPRNSEPSSGK